MSLRRFVSRFLVLAIFSGGAAHAADITTREFILVGGNSLKETEIALDKAIEEWKESAADYPSVTHTVGARTFTTRPTKIVNGSTNTVETAEFYRGSVEIAVTIRNVASQSVQTISGDDFSFNNSNPHHDTWTRALETYTRRCLDLRKQQAGKAIWVACNSTEAPPILPNFKQTEKYTEIAGTNIGESLSHVGERRALAAQGDDLSDQINQARRDQNWRLVEYLTAQRNQVVKRLGSLQAEDQRKAFIGALAYLASRNPPETETIVLSAKVESEGRIYR